MPPTQQQTKVALVTGGARRIGAAVVQALHTAGFNVLIHCHHSLIEAETLAISLNTQRPGSAFVLQQDLMETGMADVIIAKALLLAGRLDVLVNNASVFMRTDSTGLAVDEWSVLFDANVKAPFLLSLAARGDLAKHQGVIINITDIYSESPLKGYAIYCQTKAALTMQTKALALEFAPEIRVNAVAPGAIAWPENANLLSDTEQQQVINKTPLKRHGNPVFIAQAVLSLVDNPFITGETIRVDGGRGI